MQIQRQMREGTIGHRQWDKSIIESQGYTSQREHVTCYVLVELSYSWTCLRDEGNESERGFFFLMYKPTYRYWRDDDCVSIGIGRGHLWLLSLYSSDFSLFLVSGDCSS